jgi:hypothetical protein
MEQSPSWEADQCLQLVKKFSAFYGTRKFFTVLTTKIIIIWYSSQMLPVLLLTIPNLMDAFIFMEFWER